jgi:glutamine synthetase
MSPGWIDLAWPDRDGRFRFASVPSDTLERSVRSIRVDPASIGWPGIAGPLRVKPDPEGIPSPFDESREVRLCRLIGPDELPSPACSRSILDRALSRAANRQFEVIAAGELECYLLDPQSGLPVYESIENYGIVSGAPYEGVMRVVRGFREFGVPVMATNPEYGGGQFEINLHHDAGMAAADATALLRCFVAVAAQKEGLKASFVSKPDPEFSGSGLHVHQSLWQRDANVFWSGTGLSKPGSQYLAGLLDGIAELAPLGSPNSISYTRRTDGSFCPINASWGGDNRTLAVRVLAEDQKATRIEQRDAAADSNPYLVLAGQLHAGMRGIESELEPPAETTGNAYEDDSVPPLPRTLPDAFDLFSSSDLAGEVLGQEAHRVFCAELESKVVDFLAGHQAPPDPDGGW